MDSNLIMYYSLGFAFNESLSRVVLQRKAEDCKVPQLRGKWNGLGGELEQGESSLEAMQREWREEAPGAMPVGWREFGNFIVDPGHTVTLFAGILPFESFAKFRMYFDPSAFVGVREPVVSFEVDRLPIALCDFVTWLVPMASGLLKHGRVRVDMR